MDGITLPTSPAVRAGLDKAGWRLVRASNSGRGEKWRHDDGAAVWVDDVNVDVTCDSEDTISLTTLVELAFILGITPKGYKLVPEDVAKEWLESKTAVEKERTNGMQAWLDMMDRKPHPSPTPRYLKAIGALASALSSTPNPKEGTTE